MKKHFIVVAAILIGSCLNAQQDTTLKLLDEVVLTANKFPNKTSLTGKVIIVITKEQLEQSGGKDLSQVLTEQAGIYIGGANINSGKDKSIYLRGARVDHTLITIDGIPVYDASGIGGNFDLRNLSIDNIERIEILKGSQSALYGSDAIAGVINIISKKHGIRPIQGTGVISYGSYNHFRSSAGIKMKKDKVEHYLNYSFNKTNGINEASGNTNNADRDGYLQHALQVGFGVQAAKNILIRPFFSFSKINGDIDQGAFVQELDYTFTQKIFQAGVRNEIRIGSTNLNFLYHFNLIKREYIDDSVQSRNGYDIFSRGLYKGKEHFLDVYSFFPISDKIKFTGGIDFRSSQADQEYLSFGYFGMYNSKNNRDSLNQNLTGLYAALNYTGLSGFNFELGNRFNFHSEFKRHHVFNINPSYLLKQKLKLFANFSSAFRVPSLYQFYSEYGNKKLMPESAITAEAGIQYYSPYNLFTGRATVFNRKVKDGIFFYSNPATFQSQYINQDKQKDHGVELEAKFIVFKNTTITAFYSYIDGAITTKINGKDSTYFNLLRRPKNSAGVYIASQVSNRFFISSNLALYGKRKDIFFDPMTFQTVLTVLKKYTLWNIYSEYGIPKNNLRLFINLRNIFNTQYTEISGFNTTGFNVCFGIRITFNP